MEGLPLLNYNGSAYGPVRTIAEQMNGKVNYVEESNTIAITRPDVVYTKRFGDLKLGLYSEKERYNTDEPLNIWASLEYLGTENLTRISHHHSQLLYFRVTNEERESTLSVHFDMGDSTTVLRGEPLRKEMTLSYSLSDDDFGQFFNDYYKDLILGNREYYLKPGKYKVEVYLDTLDRELAEQSRLLIDITVE